MEVGFTVTSNAGSVEFRTFSPLGDGQPKLVTFSQKFGYFTVFMGRLYYRHDLTANLGNSMVERSRRTENQTTPRSP